MRQNKNAASPSARTKKKKPAADKKSSRSRFSRIGLPVFLAACILIGTAVFFLLRPNSDLKAGRDYLEAQATKDTKDLSSSLSERRRERMLAAVQSGKSSIFSLFGNSLLLGDSRMYGFEAYSFLPAEQVDAHAGDTILNIPDFVDQIAQVQPQKIYFSYGVNDMELNVGADRGDNGYAEIYEENIDKILAVSPNTQIIINSIISASPEQTEQNPRWTKIDDYNRQIREMCERRGWTYVDNDSLSEGGHANIYERDGIHFLTSFYPEWAQNMIMAGMN